jgi:hypothetical protein
MLLLLMYRATSDIRSALGIPRQSRTRHACFGRNGFQRRHNCWKDVASITNMENTMAVPFPLSDASLSIFFQESRSCLHQVFLNFMALSEDQCLALATILRLDVEVNLQVCGMVADDAAGAFFECLQSDRDPGPSRAAYLKN